MAHETDTDGAGGAGHDVIAVGASAGGLDPLRRLVSGLPADLPAAVLVVQHAAPTGPSLLGQILDGAGPLPARPAEDGEAIELGRIYVAPPDRHLLVSDGRLRLSRGPRENRARPAIDPLFRSAAVHARSRVVGVVLSGLLDDGAAGLRAVRRCGGLAVVQDPADAAYPDMPQAALAAAGADHVAPADALGPLLARLAVRPAPDPPPVPQALVTEVRITEHGMSDIDRMDDLGERTPFTCPDCGGVVWALDDPEPPRYRCHTGHAFTERVLLDGQAEATEEALLVAFRTMEERVKLLRKMAASDRTPDYAGRADELERHAERVHDLLFQTRGAAPPGEPELG